jgi:hypothetical protein
MGMLCAQMSHSESARLVAQRANAPAASLKKGGAQFLPIITSLVSANIHFIHSLLLLLLLLLLLATFIVP